MLVIFEGVFRKWVRISSLDLFYFIRDIIAFAFLLKLISQGRWKSRIPGTVILFGFAIILLCTFQIFQNKMSIPVAAFGVRNYLAPLALVLITTLYRTFQELRTAIVFCCTTTIYLEAMLAVIQSISSRDSAINFTSWGAGNALVTSGDTVRPIGTFTSSLGFSYYLIICVAVLVSIKAEKNDAKSIRQKFYVFPLMLASVVSGSRTVLLASSIILILHVLSTEHRQKKRVISFSAIGMSSIGILLFVNSLAPVLDAFIFRLKYQTEGGTGTLARIFGAIFGYRYDFKISGDGIGVYHQSGVSLGSASLWIENEVPRWIMELGILGIVIFICRQLWALKILVRSLKWKGSANYQYKAFVFALFPMLLFSGISTQPSVQGFAACLLPFAFVGYDE